MGPVASDGVLALVEEPARRSAALAALADRFATPAGRPAPLSGVRLLAPFLPQRIHAAASNYHEHAREMGTKLAERTELQPYFFMKADTAVIGPDETVLIPASSAKVDWEVELAAVIGIGGRHIAVGEAMTHVAGYTILNDVSARDLNRRSDYPFTHDWFRGKSWDTFAPLGPWVVPAGCIDDAQDLRLQLSVNDRLMQDDNSGAMIFSIAEQIAYLSSILTLRPGDVIATGTPTGVGMGMGIFLKPGDVMTASIASIGTLRNPVAATPARPA
ncbi:MAG: fumarylacetoacetate hydrolase family protein [Proteobacteria bacterium]|nr:fumarylacetoacetate hydrolase family protein [Pseudomonadota bacterium]